MDWRKEIKIPRPSLSGLRRLLNSGPELSLKKPSIRRSSKVEGEGGGAPSTKGTSGKRRSIKGPSLGRPGVLSKGPEVKMPRLISDLYADLRERHLLPLVVLLIAAMIAAPLLLGNGGEDKKQANQSVTATGAGGQTGAQAFAVVPAASRLRSPEKRLGHRQPLDPFRTVKGKEGKTHGNSSTSGTTGTGEAASPTASSGGATPVTETQPPRSAEIKVTETAAGDKELTIKESTSSTSPTTTPPASEVGGSETGSSGASSGTTSESSTTTTTEGSTGQSVVGYTVDLKTGDPEGELTEENEVAPMTKLPSAKNPLVVYVGLSQDNKRALFLMTSKVTAYYGAVHCVVDAQACQMVELTPGKTALFEYVSGETEAKYKVVLEKIVPVSQGSSQSSSEKTTRQNVWDRPAKTRGANPTPRGNALGMAHRFSK